MFTLIAIGYLDFEIFTKYDEYFVTERTPFLNKRSFATAPQRR